MEIIVKNADFSACGIGKDVSSEVIAMMAKYSNHKSNETALQAMQRFYDSVGSATLSKCTIIVPCLASSVQEAMLDLVTDEDVRASTFDDSYFNIVSGKGLAATSTSSSSTIPYRTIEPVSGDFSSHIGRLYLWAYPTFTSNKSEALGLCSDGGYVLTDSLLINSNGSISLAGLASEGLSIANDNITGFDGKSGVVGVWNNVESGTKFTIFDAENSYSTLRASDESGYTNWLTKTYLGQLYSTKPNTNTPISMFVWGVGITEQEAIAIRNATAQFIQDMGLTLSN